MGVVLETAPQGGLSLAVITAAPPIAPEHPGSLTAFTGPTRPGRPGEGTGLGLAITPGHHGRPRREATVTSVPGDTCFILHFSRPFPEEG